MTVADRIPFRQVLRDPFVLACLIALVAVAVHLGAATGDFVFDDIPAIAENPTVTGEAPLSSAFTENFWGGRPGYEHVTTWRPLTTVTFRWTWTLGGGSPLWFHLVSLLLHGCCVVLLAQFVARLSGKPGRPSVIAGLVAAAVFAVLPVHVEAIAGVVNRAELLTTAFYLIGLNLVLIAYDERRLSRYRFALVAFVGAVLSKEHGITFPAAAAVVLFYRFWGQRHAGPDQRGLLPSRTILLATATVVVGYLIARGAVLPSILGGDIPHQDNPLVSLGFFDRIAGGGLVYFHYVRLLVAPLRLSADYSFNAVDVTGGFASSGALLGWLLIAGSVFALLRSMRRQPVIAACLGLFVVFYGLISNLVILNTILIAERLMYLPSVAWCALIGVAFAMAVESSPLRTARIALLSALLVVLGGYGVRSAEAASSWRNSLTLFEASVAAFPDSVRAQTNLGYAYLDRGLPGVAHNHFMAANVLAPGDPSVQESLGDLARRLGRPAKAMEHYERAFEVRPSRAVLTELCRVSVASRRHQAGRQYCEQAAALVPNSPMVWHHLGLARMASGDSIAARTALEHAVRLEPDNQAIRQTLLELGPAD